MEEVKLFKSGQYHQLITFAIKKMLLNIKGGITELLDPVLGKSES